MYTLKVNQFLPINIETAWEFFSSPENLKTITPPSMGFEIISDFTNGKMFNGQIIKYKVRPILNIPIVWVSELKYIDPPNFFVDEQKQGPYDFWHHQHFIKKVDGGVVVEDEVNYKLPLGILGRIMHSAFVKYQLKAIFNFRKKRLEELFGK